MKVVLEYISLGFWTTLFHLNMGFVKFIKFISPFSVVKKQILEIFEKQRVKITCAYDGETPMGKDKIDMSDYMAEVVVKDKKFFYRCFEATLGLGEAYMDGMFECDNIPDLIQAFNGMKPRSGRILFEKLTRARNRQGITESLDVADAHYNLGNDLYKCMLDEGMSYTCGLWYPETKTLEEAQINKLDIIGRKLKLKPGMKVLDIGGGFGAAAKYMAQNFGVSVIVYNISKEQVKLGRENCKDVDVEFIIADYRTATGQFDAIYSIGFFEHVGTANYNEYFGVIKKCLKPEGLALTHTILSADSKQRTDRWLNKYIFPGGELPKMRDLTSAGAPFDLVTEDIQSFAKSYAKTLHCWNDNFKAHWEKDLKKNYADQFDGKFYRLWTWYLGFCEGGFLCRGVQLAQVVHSKYERKEEYYSVRDSAV